MHAPMHYVHFKWYASVCVCVRASSTAVRFRYCIRCWPLGTRTLIRAQICLWVNHSHSQTGIWGVHTVHCICNAHCAHIQ